MKIGDIANQVQKVLRDNSTVILTSLGVSGTLTTAYLAAKASFKASTIIEDEQRRLNRNEESHPLYTKEKLRIVWKLYIPAGVSGAVTIACIIGGARIGTKRTAAAYSLLTVSEKAFTEYQEKVVEQIGVKKEQAVRDGIAQDRVTQSPPSRELVVAGNGNVLCHEQYTGRYFSSDMETLRRAQNDINAKIIQHSEATLSDFYYLVGLPNTTHSSGIGWTSDKMMELRFSTVMSDDSRPCISFEYNYVKTL
jgi:Family of unknown function (DUF6353)